jgi:hypothetical protein
MNVKGKNAAVKIAMIFIPEVSSVVVWIASVDFTLFCVDSIVLRVDVILLRCIGYSRYC